MIFGFLHDFVSENLWNYLVVNEEPSSVDVIIVLSGDTGRVEHAVELYRLGYSEKILLSGSADTKIMSSDAQNSGVPASNILIENQSYTTFDNARYSLEIMLTQRFKSAIVVTSPYHTRRAGIIFEHFFKEKGIDLTICSVPFDSSTSRNWWKDSRTVKNVISEYCKGIPHRRALTLRAAKGLRPFGNPE